MVALTQAKIRTATVEDAEVINRVNIETWQSSYRGIFPDEFLANRSLAKRTEDMSNYLKKLPPQTTAFVIEAPLAGVVGFAFGGAAREKLQDFDGELHGLYVLRDYQRHGFGSLLLKSIATYCEVCKFQKMYAWTLAASPYTAFYRMLGAVEYEKKMRAFGPYSRELVAFGWSSISDLIARLEMD